MAKGKKQKKKAERKVLTVNIRAKCKEHTTLRVSEVVMTEMKGYIEDAFIPTVMRLAQKFAERDGRATISENHYLRAKDFVNAKVMEAGEYE